MRARPPDNHLSSAEWDAVRLQLLVRSGGLCEARTPDCLAAPDGRLTGRRDGRVVRSSVHHRVPQGAGGTSSPYAHRYDHVLLVDGDGVAGCHGWIERFRDAARARGLLVPHGRTWEETAAAAAATPVELASGRLVILDPAGGFYQDHGWRVPMSDLPVLSGSRDPLTP